MVNCKLFGKQIPQMTSICALCGKKEDDDADKEKAALIRHLATKPTIIVATPFYHETKEEIVCFLCKNVLTSRKYTMKACII